MRPPTISSKSPCLGCPNAIRYVAAACLRRSISDSSLDIGSIGTIRSTLASPSKIQNGVMPSLPSDRRDVVEHRVPNVFGRADHETPGRRCDVLSNCVTLEAVNPAFPLLERYRVVWKIPVDEGVAVEVEVEALLPDRGSCHHEWPER